MTESMPLLGILFCLRPIVLHGSDRGLPPSEPSSHFTAYSLLDLPGHLCRNAVWVSIQTSGRTRYGNILALFKLHRLPGRDELLRGLRRYSLAWVEDGDGLKTDRNVLSQSQIAPGAEVVCAAR